MILCICARFQPSLLQLLVNCLDLGYLDFGWSSFCFPMVQSIPGKALFPGKHSLDQLTKVVTVMGPSEELGALEVAETGAKTAF